MTELLECHKELLRTLVKLRRAGTIPEEFTIHHLYYMRSTEHIVYLRPGNPPISIPELTPLALEYLTQSGYIFSIVQYERTNTGANTNSHFISISTTEREKESSRDCYITPAGFRAVDNDFAEVDDILMRRPPVEITHSLANFRKDFPDPTRLAFVMMQFGTTKSHEHVYAAIRQALDPHQFVALRADSKQYHDDLWWNVTTYIYGCRFGIAVFERIEEDAFNPNVSLELGYMAGIGKPVCYLKERTLRTLHTDLSGKLYQPFDLQSCETTIPQAIWKWMNDKGLMVRYVEKTDAESSK